MYMPRGAQTSKSGAEKASRKAFMRTSSEFLAVASFADWMGIKIPVQLRRASRQALRLSCLVLERSPTTCSNRSCCGWEGGCLDALG